MVAILCNSNAHEKFDKGSFFNEAASPNALRQSLTWFCYLIRSVNAEKEQPKSKKF